MEELEDSRPSLRNSLLRIAVSTVVIVGCLAVVFSSMSGCTPAPPDKAPSIRGRITSITPSEAGGGGLLIEGVKEADTEFDKASVTIDEGADIFGPDGEPGFPFADLEVGMRVEAWFTGPVAESYPVQAQAEAIRVLSTP